MTVKTVEEALLADILANPADDTPRLILADWLDDHGEEIRAEFIRAQVAAARTGHVDRPKKIWGSGPYTRPILIRCGVCDFCTPHKRAEELHTNHPRALLDPSDYPFFDTWDGGFYHGVDHRSLTIEPSYNTTTLWLWRGFVETVRCKATDWLGPVGKSIVRHHPVTSVELIGKEPTRGVYSDNHPNPRLRGRPNWIWYCVQPVEAIDARHDALPPEIWSRLKGSDTPEVFSFRQYPSRKAASAAASDACLAWAKEHREHRGQAT